MPVIVILGDQGGGPVIPTGGRVTLLAQVSVQVGRAVLLARVQTGRPVNRVGLSATVKLHQPTLTPLPPLPPVPAGDVVHAPARAFIVQHGGLPVEAVSYSLGNARGDGDAKDRPTFSAELRGQVNVAGSFNVVVTAQSLTGEGSYAQSYGPFTKVGVSYTQTPTGWKTSLSTADTTGPDAEKFMPIITQEYLPWEKEKDLTTLEQAQKAKADAIKARKLGKVKCPVKNPPKRRSRTVHGLIYWVLAKLPLKYILTAPLPFPAESFWESEDTGVSFKGGTLIGVSYQTKNKKPSDILSDILGRVGWQLKYKDGVLIIGPPPPLSEDKNATVGALEVPANLLTEVRIELVNPDPESANLSTPRWYDITAAAAAQKYLPALPPDPDDSSGDKGESDFETNPNAHLTGSSTTYRDVPNVGTLADSFTQWNKTKAGGQIVREEEDVSGWVPIKQKDGSLSGKADASDYEVFSPRVRWYTGRDQRRTYYQYANAIYPTTLTRQTSVLRSYVPELERVEEVERTTMTQDWHPKGWLRRKETVKRSLGEIHKDADPDNPDVILTSQLISNELEVESWLPIGGGLWKHGIRRTYDSFQTIVENGEIVQPSRNVKQEVLVDDVTDQGPPVASNPASEDKPCPEDTPEGFGYQDQLKLRVTTNGRGDPAIIDVPWATRIDAKWADNVLAANRQRPAKRTTYQMPVPPSVKVGGVVVSYSISGSAGKCQATATVEEKLEA